MWVPINRTDRQRHTDRNANRENRQTEKEGRKRKETIRKTERNVNERDRQTEKKVGGEKESELAKNPVKSC